MYILPPRINQFHCSPCVGVFGPHVSGKYIGNKRLMFGANLARFFGGGGNQWLELELELISNNNSCSGSSLKLRPTMYS